jgi:endonuclease/exonuclease/phosphatase family metal-dependent hydrolase
MDCAMFVVASYNMRKGIGTDRRRRPDRILDVLREIDADVVALQEADRRFGARLSALPLDMIADHSAYRPVDFDIRPGGIGWHGNALLVKKSVEIVDFAPMVLPTLEPRGAVLADLRIRGASIRIVGMHLDLSGLWRRRQARAILEQVRARRPHLPVVMMGDLNEWTLHGGCLRDFMHEHRVAPTGRSFHARRPVACLDRIIASPDLRFVSAGTHHSAKARVASDHLPIWARIEPVG